ncbi:uncharacterized protein LOC129240549 [Anastrepha obliqua]|uniref:uncharacterized protein LOC129240549 n=1 Tax=Anastrepha obliqua TaxID=95512 RepID=UPI00240A26E8|nr:uncharacterized protein LOC129240549 [Anastrepha obliqua]
MTQSKSFVNKNYYGKAMGETYTEKQTNFKNRRNEQNEQEQLTYLQNYNDDVLATEMAKNITNSEQPKSCYELPHFTEHIQNSRSTSKTQSSPKNMNDLEKSHRQQQSVDKDVNSTNTRVEIINKSPPSPPPKEHTAKTIESVKNTMPKEEQIISIATNAQTNISNNLYDINFEHCQQPWSTYLTHSEVRDPSTQEGLIVNGPVVCESSTTRIKIEPVPPPADQSLYANEAATASTSTNYLLTSLISSSHTNTTTEAPFVLNECQSLVTNKFLSNLKSDAFAVRNVSTIYGDKEKASAESQPAAKTSVFDRGVDIEMTLTTVQEQKEEDNISVSSYQLDDIPNSSVDEVLFNEMKFEMSGAKIGSNVTTRTSGGSSQVKAESSPLTVASGSGVLSAVTDISKLANFGRSRRDCSLLSHSDSSTSFDAKDSVLPERTLLRRQRRLHSQCSNDKQEDPIERLNRLRARISGALSEVKVVLKHYSVDDGTETEQKPAQACSVSTINRPNDSSKFTDSQEIATTEATVKDEGPVSFRFVRKVRRQSVFSEEETNEVKNVAIPETAEIKLATDDGESNSFMFPKEYTKPEKGTIEVQDKVFSALLDPRYGNNKKLNGIECSNLENSVVVVTSPDKKKSVNLEENNGAHNLELTKNFRELENKSILEAVVESKLESRTTDIEVGKVDIQSSITDISHLAALKAKGSEADESPKGVELKTVEPHTLNVPTDEIRKPKKRVIKSKSNLRRASIAAVESSQIDPPVSQANIPLAIKIQRRPSDSEAIIKRKAKTSEGINNISTKNVITVKEKQPPVKKNATASKAELKVTTSTTHIESDTITSVDKAAVKVATKTAVPISLDTLPTQLAITIGIDDPPLNSDAKLDNTKTDDTQALSNSTNNSRSPTKLVDESNAMVAALVSQLRTGEASSHTTNAGTQSINVVTNNVEIAPPITEKAKDQDKNIREDHSRNLTTTDSSDLNNQERKPIHLKAQPTSQSKCATPQQTDTTEHCSKESHNLKPFESLYKTNDSAHLATPYPAPESNTVEIIKSDPVSNECTRLEQNIAKEILNQFLEQPTVRSETGDKMPELQVTPVPVKPVQVFAETDTGKIHNPTNKTTVKRIVRKNSIDKPVEKRKSSKSLATETEQLVDRDIIIISDNQPSTNLVTEKFENTEENNVLGEEITTEEGPSLEPPVAPTKPKKPRKVKKKVIIKREHRKLSVGESTFFKDPEQPDTTSAALETLERAIAYVTDDEDEATEQNIDPVKPVKSCMKQREFQVGEWVMYGERFRKTQIRWKKGQITERITSISYKIKLDDKEVSAHISYIKKYTGRKVNFGGKEYLEIDYEQIEEEERRARTYSIWNMV